MNKVRIRISDDVSHVIRMLYRLEINVYNIEYLSNGNVYTIDEKDLEKLSDDIYELLSYKGIKSLIRKLKRHIHFLISLTLCILLMVLVSNVIVEVDVIHNDKEIRMLVEDELYDLGIKPLIWKKSYSEIQKIKETIKKMYPEDIEWLEIVDEGMKYTVRVEERIITEIEQNTDFCNIISSKDAVVLNVVSKSGQTIVDINDYVKKGDVLISGEIKFNDSVKNHVCAEGIVYGNTWYRVSISIPFKHTVKEYSEEVKNNLGLEFGSVYNRIFRVHMDEYDVEKIKLFSFGKFAVYKEIIKAYKSQKRVYSEEEAFNVALEEARKKMYVKLDDDAQILDEKVLQSNTYNSIISLDIFYSVKEVISERIESEYIERNEDEELE